MRYGGEDWYVIEGHGYVKAGDARVSGDGEYHACIGDYYGTRRLWCFFAPRLTN